MLIIKRSPLVLIRTFVAIEFAAFALYFLAVQLGDYKFQLYNQLSLTSVLSYQTSKLLVMSGAQLLITIYAFLAWYVERFIIRPGVAIHEHGVFFRKRETVLLGKTATIATSSSRFARLFGYGELRIQNGTPEQTLYFSNISRPEKYLKPLAKILRQAPHIPETTHEWREPEIAKLLNDSEHERLEFKSSLRFDHHTRQINRDLERAAMKTVAAFLNSGGGHLVIGVDDKNSILGIHHDYGTLKRRDRDGFENHFTQLFNSMIGPHLRERVRLWFLKHGEADICVVDVAPSFEPAYLKFDNDEQFYVRTGNVSTPLKMSEVAAYTRRRFPHEETS